MAVHDKISYEVQCLEIEWWYFPRLRKWIDISNIEHPCDLYGSYQNHAPLYHTKKRAMREVRKLILLLPGGSEICVHRFITKGNSLKSGKTLVRYFETCFIEVQ